MLFISASFRYTVVAIQDHALKWLEMFFISSTWTLVERPQLEKASTVLLRISQKAVQSRERVRASPENRAVLKNQLAEDVPVVLHTGRGSQNEREREVKDASCPSLRFVGAWARGACLKKRCTAAVCSHNIGTVISFYGVVTPPAQNQAGETKLLMCTCSL